MDQYAMGYMEARRHHRTREIDLAERVDALERERDDLRALLREWRRSVGVMELEGDHDE